jgi:CHAT domain-containing protein
MREPGPAVRPDEQYLGAWKPFHLALSVTLFAELKRQRQAGSALPALTLVAFGDPQVPEWARLARGTTRAMARGVTAQARRWTLREGEPAGFHIATAAFDSVVERGMALTPLPYARQELEQLARLFPGASRIYVGEEATEERAKAIGGSARIVHFATHTLIDERSPLDSAVVLSLPESGTVGRDNGLLQAWKIFEGVRLAADLVVLSSCESALGQEIAGEGLIGLTRAFHYAGARSVMASLWNVSDRMTGELMLRFYRQLKAGLPKDVSLQRAQRAMIDRPVTARGEDGRPVELDGSAPFYWATFEISGDWR